jgi:ABC-type transporter Mla MlaB component
MATQDNSPGLLSKVAKFVRNPTKDWSELGKPAPVPEADDGKEALKRMIQRKRHDDAVRKYEFAKLRKLRQDSSIAKVDMTQVATEFRSSSGDIDDDERETTLKKIDDIEAQMSQQWWKGRGPAPSAASNVPGSSSATPANINTPPIGAQPFPPTVPSHDRETLDDIPTAVSVRLESEYQATVPSLDVSGRGGRAYPHSSRSVFSPSRMEAVDMAPTVSDPELEEAAIRYANGDDVGAEAALLAALQSPDTRVDALEGWMAALFDLYRSTGQQASFERMALEYAHRFGRSGPLWDLAGGTATSLQSPLGKPAAGGFAERTTIRWDCPPELDEATLDRLGRFVDSSSANYLLDWEALVHITPTAAAVLARWVSLWCGQHLTFTFVGAEVLLNLLHRMCPRGDKRTPEQVWKLRLDLFRLMQMQDDYELVALDFCVTYEVSPPPWREPVCHHVFKPHLSANEHSQFEATLLHDDPRAEFGYEYAAAQEDTQFALQGELLGDVSAVVAGWQQLPVPEGIWVISCSGLTRVDFSAAGGLLNWVAKAQDEGAAIEFQDVPRLVAAFFNLIGINEYARVLPRAL